MRNYFTLLIFFITSFSSHVHGSGLQCEIKKQYIKRELEFAKSQGRLHRVQGLERALQRIERNCSDNKWGNADVEKIKSKEFEVARYEAELEVAKKYNDVKEIKNKKEKLEDAERDLLRIKQGR